MQGLFYSWRLRLKFIVIIKITLAVFFQPFLFNYFFYSNYKEQNLSYGRFFHSVKVKFFKFYEYAVSIFLHFFPACLVSLINVYVK